MAAALNLDRKAKRALLLLVLLVIAILVLVMARTAVAISPDSAIAEAQPESQDELISIGGHIFLLKHGSATNRIVHWATRGSKKDKAFEVSQKSFLGESATISPQGEQRIASVAQIMGQVQSLKARVAVFVYHADPALAEMRAGAIRDALIAKGVPESRITTSSETTKSGKQLSTDPEIILILSA